MNHLNLVPYQKFEIMKLIGYISGLLSFFKDRRIIENIEQMIQKIIEKKTVRLFKVADDKKEYNRYKSLLDGSLKSVLNNEKISQALRENSIKLVAIRCRQDEAQQFSSFDFHLFEIHNPL